MASESLKEIAHLAQVITDYSQIIGEVESCYDYEFKYVPEYLVRVLSREEFNRLHNLKCEKVDGRYNVAGINFVLYQGAVETVRCPVDSPPLISLVSQSRVRCVPLVFHALGHYFYDDWARITNRTSNLLHSEITAYLFEIYFRFSFFNSFSDTTEDVAFDITDRCIPGDSLHRKANEYSDTFIMESKDFDEVLDMAFYNFSHSSPTL